MPKLKTLRPRIATLGMAPQGERKPWAHRDAFGRERSTTERGYGAAWQRQRLAVLARDNHLCQCDRCKGGALRLTVAREVDHVIPKARGGTDELSNLQAIATECHRRKTIEENGGTVRPRIGLDGYAIEE